MSVESAAPEIAKAPREKIMPHSHEHLKRINSFLQFVERFETDFGPRFSAAVCGSLALGTVNANSDIDCFLAIEPRRFEDALNSTAFRAVFGRPSEQVPISLFRSGFLHAYRPPEATLDGYRVTINLMSYHVFHSLCQLHDFPIRKFRYGPATPRMEYRGFGHAYCQPGVFVDLKTTQTPDGVISETRSVVWMAHEPYIHINVDKFFTCFLVRDYFSLAKSQTALRVRIFEEFARTGHLDPLGFLYARHSASAEQLSAIHNSIPGPLLAKVSQKDEQPAQIHADLAKVFENAHKILILTGPSGIGKDTVARQLLRGWPGVAFFTPTTTREPRPSDEPFSYCFRSEQEFLRGRDAGDFLYWQFNGISTRGMAEYYAVPYTDLLRELSACERLVMTVGGEGFASFMKRIFPNCTSVCLWPTSSKQLEAQLRARRSECSEDIDRRLELFGLWEPTANYFDHLVVNLPGKLQTAVNNTANVVGLPLPYSST